MKINQLQLFCSVVEEGTIKAAADKNFCVPSNITTRIQELEDELQVQLFTREKNRLYVTPKGRLLYQRAQRIFKDWADTEKLVQEKGGGALRVGCLDVALISHLPAKVARYRQLKKHISLELIRGPTLALEKRVIFHELDMAITDGPIEHPLLDCRFAFRESLVLITPKEITQFSPDILSDYDFLSFSDDSLYRIKALEWLAGHQKQPKKILEMNYFAVILACVEAGTGISCFPLSLIEKSVFSQQYDVNIHHIPELATVDLYFIWKKNQLNIEIQHFMDIIIAEPDHAFAEHVLCTV
ncbi:LysR family transcriptional regulator [Aquirhabdus sp.]|uniref:LysR family transcriptional regulator n=1 Tax=Aquirhabdus sp. TaxID=2824160 RepID=UPI00396C5198